MLPWYPEPIQDIKERLPKALEREFDFTDLERLPKISEAAGTNRAHVFDFEEGIRMIVSRENNLVHGHVIHLSFGSGPPDENPHYARWNAISIPLRAGELTAELFPNLRYCVQRWLSLRAFHVIFLSS